MRPSAALPPAAVAAPLDSADEAMLDSLQRDAFGYFVHHTNRHNGLVADTSRAGSHAGIAAVGFALSAYPVAVERGWLTRAEALQRSLAALRFFRDSDQSGAPESTGYKCFYFHFLQMDSGARAWRCEAALIDTTLLLAGLLYHRVDWGWAQPDGAAVVRGWKPGRGFLNSGFNDTVGLAAPAPLAAQGTGAAGWIAEGHFGLDQKLIVLMIENFRSGLPWRLLRSSAPIRKGSHRAGFRGGWLADSAQP